MGLNCKCLGDILELVDARNKNEITTNVLGISINKEFMPSVANVIGTDLSKYKLLNKGIFACNPMHVGRDKRLPIALYRSDEPGIVSPAYFMFKVKNSSDIDTEYLMLWFQRPDFDRLCWFMTDASVRGGLSWEDLCRIKIALPSIEEQRKIVHNYKVITGRIELLKKINENLETQAQALYKAWFEDFKPFGGVMPLNWHETTINDIAQDIVCGKTPSTDNEDNYGGDIPFITIPDMHGSIYTVKTARTLSELGVSLQANKTLPANSVCVSCIATVGLVCLTAEPSQTNQQINSIICKHDVSPFYIYLKMTTLTNELKALGAGGSTTLNVNKTLFGQIKILYPDSKTIKSFHAIVAPMFSVIRNNELEMEKLKTIQDLSLTYL